MSLKIRLARHGAKKRPYYRIVVADARAPRDGRFIDRVGSYNPMLPKDSEERVKLDVEKIKEWLGKGARPTERVARFLGAAGLWEWKAGNNPNKGKPGAAALQLIKDKEERAIARKEAEAEAAEAAKEAKAAADAAAKEAAEAEKAAAKEAAEAAKNAPAEEAPAADAAPAEAAPAAAGFVDAIVLVDGIGPKGEEVLAAAGITKLTQIVDLTAEQIAELEEKIGKPGVFEKQEWGVQAKEMIGGAEPRSQVDKDLAAKMRAEASASE